MNMRKNMHRFLSLALAVCMVLTMVCFTASAADEGEWLKRVRIHLVGDSTVASYTQSRHDVDGITGWGQALSSVLNDRALVYNWAISGATTQSFLEGCKCGGETACNHYGKQWHTVLKSVKSGDFVLIQFGHNDCTNTNTTYGITKEAYKANLTTMVKDVLELNAVPVLVTSPERKTVATMNYSDTFNGYISAVTEVKNENAGTYLIDLNSWSKTKYAELKEANELDSFFTTAEGEITHFSEKGAFELANQVLNGLIEINPAFESYKLTGDDVQNLNCTNVYMYEDFEKAITTTSETTGRTTVSLGTNNRFYSTAVFENGDAAADETNYRNSSVVTEADGDKALYMNSGTLENGGYVNGTTFTINKTTDDYVVLDFKAKLSGKNGTNQMEIRLFDDKGVLMLSDIYITKANGKVSIGKVYTNDKNTYYTIDDALCSFNLNDYNDMRIILDQSEAGRKMHVLLNGALVCADIPLSTNSTGKLNKFTLTDTVRCSGLYLDDIRVYGVAQNTVAQMIIDGADGFFQDKVFEVDKNRFDYRIFDTDAGYGSAMYMPASAASENQSFAWGDLQVGGSGAAMTIDTANAGTTEPYVKATIMRAPQGYAARCYVDLVFKPTVKVGNTTYSMQTAPINIKNFVLSNTAENVEIGVPKFLDEAWYVTGTGTSTKTVSSAITTANKNNNEYIYTETMVKNTGEKDITLIGAVAYYCDGQLASISGVTTREVKAGERVSFSISTKVKNIPESATAKFMIFDADTLKPMMKAIEAAWN